MKKAGYHLAPKPKLLQSATDSSSVQETAIVDSEIETVCDAIDALRKESMQISELLRLEQHYLHEVVDQLKQIMMHLKMEIRLNSSTIPKNNSPISDAILTSECIVCIINEGKVLYRLPLYEFQTDTVLKIIGKILPEIRSRMNDSKKEPIERLSSIEKISKELRRIVSGERTGEQQVHPLNNEKFDSI